MHFNKKSTRFAGFSLFAPLLFSLILFSAGCQKNPGEYTLGQKFIESQTNLALIDTFSVALSTAIQDTIVSSASGNILLGNYQDDLLGKITCHSYFQIGVPSVTDVEKTDVYDSLSLVLVYNNYFFGDTTKSQRISVHQLTEPIKCNADGYIYSNQTFTYNQPLGSRVYTPHPNGENDTLYIRLSDALGQELFAKLQENSEIITESDYFLNYFYGLALISDANEPGAIVGFNGYAGNAALLLHTTRQEEYAVETITYAFGLNDYTKQFNNIQHDYSATELNALVNQRQQLSSTQTNGLAFLQGGTGLCIRVDFPSLKEILMLNRGEIAEARLCISPLRESYREFPLPTDLLLYQTDKINRKTSLVLANASELASGTLEEDELYQEDTAYVFDLTQYLTDELADAWVDAEQGLLIVPPTQENFDRLIVDARYSKLKIYYLSY